MTRRVLACLAALAALGACAEGTGPGANAPVLGTWDYSATGLDGRTMTGTLSVTSQGGGLFSGNLGGTETLGATTSSLQGPVNGQSLNDSTVIFDAFLDDNTDRQHAGVVAGDSITGDWMIQSVTSGSWIARRRPAP